MGITVTSIGWYATSVEADDGKFHPAVRQSNTSVPYYWCNVKQGTRDEARAWAQKAIDDMIAYCNEQTEAWNVIKL